MPDMDISILSLIVAALAVFFGPVISWKIAKHQICASAELARDQMRSALEMSNKQITAPMRQAWINKLRELLVELTSSALHYWEAGYEDRTEEEYQRVTFLQAHIQLMLNSNEDDHQCLEVLMRRMVTEIEKGRSDEFPGIHGEVIDLSRTILKREWDRVKEPYTDRLHPSATAQALVCPKGSLPDGPDPPSPS